MAEWMVTWSVDVTAEDPVQAARKAREMQVRPGTIARAFDVTPVGADGLHIDEMLTTVDLDRLYDEDGGPTCVWCDDRLHRSTLGWVNDIGSDRCSIRVEGLPARTHEMRRSDG